MLAITQKEYGGPEVLILSSVSDLTPAEEEILLEVHATALNRADLLQRRGKYPPPKGASDILGLEVAGEVIAIGKKVKEWQPGDQVFGLIPGGGYASQAVIHKDMAMRIPSGMTMIEAAAIPEVFLTAFQALFWLAKIQEREKVLIHAGASGVGTAAIQLAKSKNAFVLVTASAPKHATCLKLGANETFDYKQGNFSFWVMDKTDNKGVDIIVDFIGDTYFPQNIECLCMDGRLIQLALMGGSTPVNFNLGLILRKRLQIIGSTLRNRDLSYQIMLTKEFEKYALGLFQHKVLKPIIGKVFDLAEVQEAHRYMESNKSEGKIILKVKHE